MTVYISKDILGTNAHLGWDGTSFIRQNTLDVNDFVYDNDLAVRSLRPLCDLKSMHVSFPSTTQQRIWSQIPGVKLNEVKWASCLTAKNFKQSVQEALEQLWLLFKDMEGTYYVNDFYVIRKLLLTLSAAKIDTSLYYAIMRNENVNKNSLSSFCPDDTGYCKIPVYNQVKTVTGRLTVDSGPNILTLKKVHRRILQSRYDKGRVIQIDFVSLEPRVLLTFLEKDAQSDVYAQIAKEVFKEKIDRETAKVLTLGVVYGLSSNNLAEKLSIHHSVAKRLNKKIRDYFKLNDLTRLLINTAECGKIKNTYGREINVSGDAGYVLVNRFVQSSAADAALLSFAHLVNHLSRISDKILPLFLIHDAIILDVPEEHFELISELCKPGLDVPVLNKRFPVQIDIISQNK